MDWLIDLDKQLFLFLNSLRADWLDPVMFTISAKHTWFPLYIITIFAIYYKQNWKWASLAVIGIILTIVAADQGSVHLFKEVFCRLRPTHDPEISDFTNIVNNYRGGSYSFVSSHAANTFAFASFTLLYFKKRWYTKAIIAWAAIVSYSRIYLGVHFPADILGGALLGSGLGFFFWWLFSLTTEKLKIEPAKRSKEQS